MNRQGITRLVFVFNSFVIKIPNFLVQHSHFLAGCKNNWQERCYWKSWRKATECDLKDKVVPTLFCTWFGLIQIQSRASILNNDAFLNEQEILYFGDISTDTKPSNFGYYKGKLVCVDYS